MKIVCDILHCTVVGMLKYLHFLICVLMGLLNKDFEPNLGSLALISAPFMASKLILVCFLRVMIFVD